MICANQAPDHTTVARFRQRHEAALAELFGEVLALCARSGEGVRGALSVRFPTSPSSVREARWR